MPHKISVFEDIPLALFINSLSLTSCKKVGAVHSGYRHSQLSLTIYYRHLQVAITLVYRYQPPASTPIDAGELIADNGKIGDYRYYFESLFWGFAGRRIQS